MRRNRTSERTRAKSAMSLTGLERKSSAPDSSPRTRSAASVSAVTITTGMSDVRASALSRRQTSNPSMRGIMTSSRMRSGRSSWAIRSAFSPSFAASTLKYSLASLASSSLTFTSTSSTTRMRADMSFRSVQEAGHGLEEIGDRDRLRDVSLAAAFADLLFVTLHGEGSHRDHRNGAQLLVFLDPFGHLEAGHLGQLDIHQNQVGMMLARQFQRFHAILGLQNVVAVRFQQIVEELHVQVIVFDDEDPLTGHLNVPVPDCFASENSAGPDPKDN